MNTRFVNGTAINLVIDGVRVEFEIPAYPDALRQKLFAELEKIISEKLVIEHPNYQIAIYYHELDNKHKVTVLIVTNQAVDKIYHALNLTIQRITTLMSEWDALYEYIKLRATAEKGGEL